MRKLKLYVVIDPTGWCGFGIGCLPRDRDLHIVIGPIVFGIEHALIDPQLPPHIARAFAILEEGRASHVQWYEHLKYHETYPEFVCDACKGRSEYNGWGSAREEQWIDNYDHVIKVLKGLVV